MMGGTLSASEWPGAYGEPKASELAAAQLKVMEAVPYVLKRGGEQLPYTYAGEADLIRAVRPAMIKNKITMYPWSLDFIGGERAPKNNGRGTMMYVRVSVTYRFTHAPSGEHVNVWAFGEAMDTGDKSLPKAMTIALKYALRQFLMIETGDDPDMVAHQPEVDEDEHFARAREKIEACDSEEAVDELLNKVAVATLDDGSSVFSVDQLSEIAVFGVRKKYSLRGDG